MSIDPADLYTDVTQVREAASPTGTVDNVANTAGSLDDAQLQALIEEAQGVVDGYVGARYELPLTKPFPTQLKSIATSVALYLATLTYRRSKDLSDQDPVVRRYRQAMDMLVGISTGKVVLQVTVDPTSGSPASGDAVVVNPYQGNLFGLETIPDYQYPRRVRYYGG